MSFDRLTMSCEKLDELKVLLEDYRADFFDRDDFCKSINYILTAWSEFTNFIDDITLPLSNNDTERAFKHSVLGRKNFNGSKMINGADVSPMLYTIIETCKKCDLDPSVYMKYVIEENQSGEVPLSPLRSAEKIKS